MSGTLTNVDARSMLVGGAWEQAASGDVLETENPATEQVIATVPAGDAVDVDRAVEAAAAAAPEWAAIPWTKRAEILRELATRIRERVDELALIDVDDAGLPFKGMYADVASSAAELDYFAGIGGETKGTTIPTEAGAVAYTVREPYGVVGRIIPYNHPFKFAVGKVAAPLVAGNSVLLKPPEQAPLSALELGRMVEDLLPPGVLNIVTGRGKDVGAAIAAHPGIPRVAFTGSVAAGRAVMRAGAEHIKHVTLELGGKNPMVICPDAELAKAAKSAVLGMNLPRTMGQSCQSNSRLLVHREIADEFTELLLREVEALEVGDPRDPDTDIGPLAFRDHFDRVHSHIAAAKEDGARLLTGGGRPEGFPTGYYVEPTIFDDVTPQMRLAQQEVFGPVIALMHWSTEEEMLQLANGVEYGLTAKIWTRDMARAQRFTGGVQAGAVWVNDRGTKPTGLPFGGYKLSGLGKESSTEELLSYTQEKSVFSREHPA